MAKDINLHKEKKYNRMLTCKTKGNSIYYSKGMQGYGCFVEGNPRNGGELQEN